jgi:hypothetical protein
MIPSTVSTQNGHSSEQRVKKCSGFLVEGFGDGETDGQESEVGGHSFRFAAKLGNSAGVLPQLDITNVGHLLSAFLCRVVVDALEVDGFNVMAVTGDKIRFIV